MIKQIHIFLFLISSFIYGQNINLDKYQYVIVEEKFDFVNSVDKYKTSSLTKFLFKKKGFKVYLTNETLPKLLIDNKCLALYASVKNESSMLTIKNAIVVKDCYGKTIYTSKTGKSMKKEYEKGYHEAIRNAFKSMSDFNYSYISGLNDLNENIKEEVIIAANISDNIVSKINNIPKTIQNTKVNKEEIKEKKVNTVIVEILYAQTRANGFQLVNTTPEIIFEIRRTGVKDVFIIKNKNGILYKVGEKWFAEYLDNDLLIHKEYQVKF